MKIIHREETPSFKTPREVIQVFVYVVEKKPLSMCVFSKLNGIAVLGVSYLGIS